MDQVALRKKLENFWYYYKWHTLGGLFLLVTALVAVHSCRMRVNPDLYLLYMRDETPIASQTAELEGWLSAMVEDINEDGEKTARVMSYSRSNMWNGDDSAAMVVQVNAGDAVLYLVSETTYNTLHQNGVLQDLSAMGDSPYLEGDRYKITDSGVLKELEYFESDTDRLYLCMRKVAGTSFEKEPRYLAQQEQGQRVLKQIINKEKSES